MKEEPEEDPRLNLQPKATLREVIMDLDEAERHRCLNLERRMERLFRKSKMFDEAMLPSLWVAAHDRAIMEVAAARAVQEVGKDGDWGESTWRKHQGGDSSA